jgi:hypothetical protein
LYTTCNPARNNGRQHQLACMLSVRVSVAGPGVYLVGKSTGRAAAYLQDNVRAAVVASAAPAPPFLPIPCWHGMISTHAITLRCNAHLQSPLLCVAVAAVEHSHERHHCCCCQPGQLLIMAAARQQRRSSTLHGATWQQSSSGGKTAATTYTKFQEVLQLKLLASTRCHHRKGWRL